jgi:hypothetical protein
VVDEAHALGSTRPEDSIWLNMSEAERAGSIFGDGDFGFDEPWINTKAYRQVMAAKERRLLSEAKVDKGKGKKLQRGIDIGVRLSKALLISW